MIVIMGLAGARWHQIDVAYLPVVLVPTVAFGAYVGGFRQGWLSAALAWVYLSISLFATSLSTQERLQNGLVWTVVLPVVVLLTGFLHQRAREQEFKPWKGNVEPFRLASESVLDLAVVLLNRGGQVTSWNTGAQRIFGWTGTEMAGRTLVRCCAAEEQSVGAPTAQLRAAAREGRFEGELGCVRREGRLFRAKTSIIVLRDEQGKVAGYTASFQDLSDRQKAASALLRRAHQQAAVAALSEFALQSTDQQVLLEHAVMFIMQTWSLDYCAVFELQPETQLLLLRAGAGWKEGCVGRLTVEATPGSMMEFALKSAEPVMVSDFAATTRFTTPDFLKEHHVTCGIAVVVPGPSGTFGVVGVFSRTRCEFSDDDLGFLHAVSSVLATAQVRNQAEQENQKLAAFPQFNPNPVFELAADGQLTYFNSAAATMAALLHRTHPADILPPQTAEIVRDCLATGRNRLDLETQQEGRALFWSFHPIPAIGRVHLYAEDITDRRNLEAQLRQSQKMEAIGQLASGVAHDFNNILTIMQGYSVRLLTKDPRVDQRGELEQILDSTERAAALTKQLLAFSRKQNIHLRCLDLREIVANMTQMLERLIGENISLQLKKPDALPAVSADAGMMEQVLLNLVVNARDAMPEGGSIVVESGAVEVDERHVQQHPEARAGTFVRLQVTDTGCGMDADTIGHIFEPFFTTKGPGKGTGLGLATVYGIVQQHHGWIEIESQVGRGTTFSVLLPVAAGTLEAAPLPTEAPAVVCGGSETILVVEDEALLRELACATLKDLGYTVLEASTGLEALVVWGQHRDRIQLVLTDMIMPGGLTGRELSDRLRGDRPDLRVVFSSGYSAELPGMDIASEKGTAFLQKPYRPPLLAKTVRSCLDAKP